MSALTQIRSSHGSVELPWLTGLAVALAILLWAGFGPAPAALVFDRAAIASGEVWRLLTGHLVHSDAGHALWDIGALAIIGWLMEAQGRRRMLLAALVGVVAVDVCLWWAMPGLEFYCGLSGLLNTLFVVALAGLWKAHRHPVFPLAALVLGVKLVAEIVAGQSLVVSTAWPSVPLTHLAGSLGGLCCWAMAATWNRRRRRDVEGRGLPSFHENDEKAVE
ncbi:rhombosortase [Uliginosibacterium sp. 31-16]|uniref:rhombosortase n=1 Tax=Uliginosibacterium sp. 31-16 TaxID=3068315 RepID=UPI00273FB133|nr:rhombosortase [Uliginosibacterium sp. 31-16]MDP5239844.1 rhombosortase [Uliginosibacterium sp. 31-16]